MIFGMFVELVVFGLSIFVGLGFVAEDGRFKQVFI